MSSKKASASSKKAGSAKKEKQKQQPSEPMDPAQELALLKQELAKERDERNFFQLERDKINAFWQVTKNQLDETKAELLNKDRSIEEQEEKHLVEIKVYKQKVKHLLYEYQNNVAHLQTDGEQSLKAEQETHIVKEKQLKRDKRSLKLELKEFELAHEEVIRNLKQKHDVEITRLRNDFERKAKELYAQYDRRAKNCRDDLELRRRNEIHEIEERKNSQIAALMRNHEKAFAEIKNYYNDITLNNLALINSLKEQVEEMKKKEERNEKLMAEITAENKRLSEPLQTALAEGELLKKKLQSYENDKLALRNSKARVKVLESEIKSLRWEHEVLLQRFEKVEQERDELYHQFVDRVMSVQQKSGLKNMLLEKQLEGLKESLEKKELQLNEVVASVNLDPKALGNLTKRLDDIVENKNAQIKHLQFEMAKLSKSHNEMMKVYEAKLTEFSIPIEELGFKPMMMQK